MVAIEHNMFIYYEIHFVRRYEWNKSNFWEYIWKKTCNPSIEILVTIPFVWKVTFITSQLLFNGFDIEKQRSTNK